MARNKLPRREFPSRIRPHQRRAHGMQASSSRHVRNTLAGREGVTATARFANRGEAQAIRAPTGAAALRELGAVRPCSRRKPRPHRSPASLSAPRPDSRDGLGTSGLAGPGRARVRIPARGESLLFMLAAAAASVAAHRVSAAGSALNISTAAAASGHSACLRGHLRACAHLCTQSHTCARTRVHT
jgi:hypothetical protein